MNGNDAFLRRAQQKYVIGQIIIKLQLLNEKLQKKLVSKIQRILWGNQEEKKSNPIVT